MIWVQYILEREIIIHYKDLDKVSQDIANVINLDTDNCIIYNLGSSDSHRTINVGRNQSLLASLVHDNYLII